ncbi:MAG: hypothetical protein OEW08_00810 [Gammaproteobacteria bacterium]|nr:hypothetical protein [Gammaproteobacteria bacterium]
MSVYANDKLISEARRLAAEFRAATGKPLGISNEIAEFDAARLLNLELCKERPGGYDAIGRQDPRIGKRIQIKARAIFDESKSGHRIGQLKLDKEWDSVLLVVMDEKYFPVEIYEAQRADVIQALEERPESNRNKRGMMSVARFKNIAELIWTSVDGEIQDVVWDNRSAKS